MEKENKNKVYIFEPSPDGIDEKSREFFTDFINLILSGGDRKMVKQIVDKYSQQKDTNEEEN